MASKNLETGLQDHDRAWQDSITDSNIAAIIGEDLTDRLDQYCAKQGLNRREALRGLLAEALEDKKPVKTKRPAR
jgi:hypothetical protein